MENLDSSPNQHCSIIRNIRCFNDPDHHHFNSYDHCPLENI